MQQASHHIKRFLLALIIAALFLPLIQQKIRFADEPLLHGAFLIHEKIPFSKTSWLDGSFQEKYELWLNDDIGFRHSLFRLHNQIIYSAFGQTPNNNVIIGKQGYLFEPNYIQAWRGKDFIGQHEVDTLMKKLRRLQDTLSHYNKTLLICLAAGKASYFPEFIPDSCRQNTGTSNYTAFAKGLVENGINHIDYNKWFLQMKPTAKYPLYPQTGIHWSNYGAVLAMDSLIKYVEHKRSIDMPSALVKSITMQDSLISPDEDIGLALNLMHPLPHYKMAYPELTWEDSTGRARPRLMAVSDSYFWQFMNNRLAPFSFSSVEFYYYNESVIHSYPVEKTPALDQPGALEIGKSEVIMIMATEANLGGLGWGFINEAYDYYVLHKAPSDDKMIKYYERAIRMDKVWLESIEKKAREKGVSIDEMIRLDAEYMAAEAKKK